MKLSDFNRFMAIARCVEYAKDYFEIVDLFERKINKTNPKTVEGKIEGLCKKWNIPQSIPPYFGKDEGKTNTFMEIFKNNCVIEKPVREWPNALSAYPVSEVTWASGKIIFTSLAIDLSKGKKEIVQEFGEKVDAWIKGVPKERKRRETLYDPWKVHDLHERDGLSFSEIARRLHGQEYERGDRSPSVNDELWPPYKRVRRAYNQAQAMIEAVSGL